MSYWDIIVTAVIVGLVLFAALRTGQANPVGTGRVLRRLTEVEAKVAEHSQKLDNLEGGVDRLREIGEENARNLNLLRIETAADRGTTERTWSAVDRLQRFFIEQAIMGRKEP